MKNPILRGMVIAGIALMLLVSSFAFTLSTYAATNARQVTLDTLPTPDFSSGGTDAQSAQMTFVRNQLSPFQRVMNSDQFNQLVGDVLGAHDIKECAADLLTWAGTELEVEPTNTSDACAGTWDDIQTLIDGLAVKKVY